MDVNPAEALRNSVEDPEAFALFYRRFFDSVLVYLTRRVYDPEVALDLTAETFAQSYLSRARFRGSTTAEAEAWVYRIAQRKLGRYFRRSKVERKALRELRLDAPRIDADRRARIEDLAKLDHLRDALRDALAEVSEDQQAALRLRAIEELPYSEVARRLGISEQAARARVSRGLKALADILDKQAIQEATI